MEQELSPIRARAAELKASPEKIHATLDAGADKARQLAVETMGAVRTAMGFE